MNTLTTFHKKKKDLGNIQTYIYIYICILQSIGSIHLFPQTIRRKFSSVSHQGAASSAVTCQPPAPPNVPHSWLSRRRNDVASTSKVPRGTHRDDDDECTVELYINICSGKQTCPLEMVVSNRNLLFQRSIFRGYVSFREGNQEIPSLKGKKHLWNNNFFFKNDFVEEFMYRVSKVRTACFFGWQSDEIIWQYNCFTISWEGYHWNCDSW